MINISYPLSLEDNNIPKCVAAIGFFDGIHKGHRQVINRAVEEAHEKGLESAVITFHPHPSVILKNSKKSASYITPLNEKKDLLEELKVDRVYVIEFNKALSKLTPEQFIDTYIKQLNVSHLIAGFDFTFGHKGAGNMSNMAEFAHGAFTFETVEKVELEAEKVSSTKIRQLLDEGKIEDVNRLLGHDLRVRGTVVEGDKRGRTIGFPTANIRVSDDYYLPKVGSYGVECYINDELYYGMANLGLVPTFKEDEREPTLEVYIFDFDETIYGEDIIIKWNHFIRNEKKFSSVDELINQLNQDEITVRANFNLAPAK